MPLPAPPPPPPIVTLPAPEALPALPAPPSDEEMVVDPEAERRKRPRDEVDDVQPASGNEGAGAQSSGHDGQQQEESQTVDLLLEMATTSVQSSQEVHVEDDTVRMTRTEVVVQRAVKVEPSQNATVRSSQRRCNADSSQPPTKRVGQAPKNGNPTSIISTSRLNPLRATSNGR